MSKIVLRLLPLTLTEEEYRDFVGQEILSLASWQTFFASESPDRNSIGYLHFNKSKEAESAISALNGKRVGKTNYKAVACMAPCQRVPANADGPIDGNIEDESRYIQFLEAMKLKAPLPPAVPDIKPKDFKTPLVEYMESLSRKRTPNKPQAKQNQSQRRR